MLTDDLKVALRRGIHKYYNKSAKPRFEPEKATDVTKRWAENWASEMTEKPLDKETSEFIESVLDEP